MPEREGLYVWRTQDKDGNSWASQIVRDVLASKVNDLYVKVANGIYDYPFEEENVKNLEYIFSSIEDDPVRAWGWHYVFLDYPIKEAKKAYEQIQRWNLVGYVINAESHAKGKFTNAKIFIEELRSLVGEDFTLGLSSYRYPMYHQKLPWKQFLSVVDFNQPQVYWLKAHNAVEQLDLTIERTRAYEKLIEVDPVPIHPLLCAFSDYPQEWKPKETSMIDVFEHARKIGLPSAAWYEWKASHEIGRWDVIEEYTDWESTEPDPVDDTPYSAEDLESKYHEGMAQGWKLAIKAAKEELFKELETPQV